MKVVITGGLGFLGLGIARKLIERGAVSGRAIDAVTLFDADVPDALPDGLDQRVETVAGDIADKARVRALIDSDDVCVFHLASVVSAGAEQDFDLAMRVNLDGTRNVLDACRARDGAPRVVFASSVAVYGGPLPDTTTDATRETPQTTYGMTKAVGELMINEYSRKGYIDGRAARLATVIVRPGPPNAAASGFASGVFREPLAGKDYALPVGPDTRMMVQGTRNCIAGLIALMEADGKALGADRAVALPNAQFSVTEMIQALEKVAAARGISLGAVSHQPDPEIEAIVKSWPLAMDDARARALGLHGDESLDRIIEEYLDDFGAARGT